LELVTVAVTTGVAVGLAWTPAGGDILFIESTRMPGKGQLRLTGSLGDVMRESAEAARTWLRAHAEALHVDREALERSDLHLHVPAGAVPKDGPSAGVVMVTSLASLLTGRAAPPDVAMTGEITLRGKVLPIGGVKEKTLAALRAGIKTVMLPKRNEKDLEDVPAEAKAKLQFVFLERVEDAIRAAIGELPKRERKAA
jgi:ATP-dependent Lon protease